MVDIVERLRAVDGDSPYLNHEGVAKLCQEAADELCRQQLRAAEAESKLRSAEQRVAELAESRAEIVEQRNNAMRDSYQTRLRLETSETHLGVCMHAIQEAIHCLEAQKTPSIKNLAAALDSDEEAPSSTAERDAPDGFHFGRGGTMFCDAHGRWPCKDCGTSHYEGCRCVYCYPPKPRAVVGEGQETCDCPHEGICEYGPDDPRCGRNPHRD